MSDDKRRQFLIVDSDGKTVTTFTAIPVPERESDDTTVVTFKDIQDWARRPMEGL